MKHQITLTDLWTVFALGAFVGAAVLILICPECLP